MQVKLVLLGRDTEKRGITWAWSFSLGSEYILDVPVTY